MTTAATRLMWHHSAHQHWGKARLCFWRLSFSPTYHRGRVRLGIERALGRHAVSSYVAYEVLGDFDVLVRLWLPTSITTDELDAALYDELLSAGYLASDVLEVTSVHWHWVWADSMSADMREPEPSSLLSPTFTEAEMESLDQAVDLSAGGLDERSLTQQSRALLDRARAENLVARLTPGDGIKFFAIVSRPVGTFGRQVRERLSRNVTDLAKSVGTSGGDGSRLGELSVYGGSGFGAYLIVGRMEPQAFYEVVEELTEGINELGLDEYAIRVHTYVAATPDFMLYSERLGFQTTLDREVPIDVLLSRQESEQLELKGSAFVSLRGVVDDGEPSFNHDKGVEATIVKSVCGLLNSPRGGHLVIGVVEEAAFLDPKRYRTEEARHLAEVNLSTRFPAYRSRAASGSIPALRISGVEPDFQFLGTGDWDRWRQRLQQTLRNNVEPNPLPWITIRDEILDGRTVAVVSIQPNSTAWSYVVSPDREGVRAPRFYVREGNSTREYVGIEADDYKRGDKSIRGGGRR